MPPTFAGTPREVALGEEFDIRLTDCAPHTKEVTIELTYGLGTEAQTIQIQPGGTGHLPWQVSRFGWNKLTIKARTAAHEITHEIRLRPAASSDRAWQENLITFFGIYVGEIQATYRKATILMAVTTLLLGGLVRYALIALPLKDMKPRFSISLEAWLATPAIEALNFTILAMLPILGALCLLMLIVLPGAWRLRTDLYAEKTLQEDRDTWVAAARDRFQDWELIRSTCYSVFRTASRKYTLLKWAALLLAIGIIVAILAIMKVRMAV